MTIKAMKALATSLAVLVYCHFSVSLLCLNVLFDLIIFGLPLFVISKTPLLSPSLYLRCTSAIINWTTPIVLAMPILLSGTEIYCNDVDLLVEAKASESSLLLSNHGARIDWLVGMLVGYAKKLGDKASERIRVGFVCEALIQFMPIVGWYRKLVAHDIFVWRSFSKDAATIRSNIQDFVVAREKRLLFLAPEGVVVDFGQKDFDYIRACGQFCIEQKYDPFDYVLTPRYKGSVCLLQNVKGPIISVCMAYVRNGRLLNCSLRSLERVVPDIYTLLEGIGGSPTKIFIHLKKMEFEQDIMNEPKKIFMENYKEKNELLKKWDEKLSSGTADDESWMSQFTPIQANQAEYALYQILHTALMMAFGIIYGKVDILAWAFVGIFALVSTCHTIGSALNGYGSTESVPFETGIKAVARCVHELCLFKAQKKE